MWNRYSFVQNIKIKKVLFSSVVEIGDTNELKAHSNILAVQRFKELYYVNEGNFNYYPTFREPIPVPALPFSPPTIKKYNECPNICVDNVNILGISSSGLMQIGSTNDINLESRIVHIRQLEA